MPTPDPIEASIDANALAELTAVRQRDVLTDIAARDRPRAGQRRRVRPRLQAARPPPVRAAQLPQLQRRLNMVAADLND
jgi:hypothetical protein